jgi:hypothetical protein
MENEPLCNFSVIGLNEESHVGCVYEESKQFLLKILYDSTCDEKFLEDNQFSFMR